MQKLVLALAPLLLTLSALAASAEQPLPLETTIERVGLFKNGLAVITRSAVLVGDGVYEIDDLPQPVHGTLWIESREAVIVRTTTREVLVDAPTDPTGVIQRDLVGARVTVMFKDEKTPPISGQVVKQSSSESSHVILDSASGRVYLDPTIIAYLQVDEAGPAPSPEARSEPVVRLERKDAGAEMPITITYLARGMAWMPSYRIDIEDPSIMHIEQSAVIRNELTDLGDVEIELISGFPSIEFEYVTSPIASQAQLSTFFAQLSQTGRPRGGSTITQQITLNYAAPGNSTDGGVVLPTSDGIDMHHHGIGRIDLAKGDAILLPLAAADTPYERIIEWVVPDTRDEWGRMIETYQRQQNPQAFENTPWDALRFKNPFGFPMTTAPAMIVDGQRFGGQSTSTWVNPSEQTTLRVTKALSVRTSAVETEEEGERDLVRVGGRKFRKPTVAGEVLVCNHRAETVKVLIRRAFSGELLESEGEPEERLLEAGVYSINQRNELVWTLNLAPGETRTLSYRYAVLVLH